jgi:hypothetical protein
MPAEHLSFTYLAGSQESCYLVISHYHAPASILPYQLLRPVELLLALRARGGEYDVYRRRLALHLHGGEGVVC